MSDIENESLTAKEALLQKQRKEKKSLQAEIQTIKKAVPKGDKKRDKLAKQKISELENALTSKHKHELEALDQQQKNEGGDSPAVADGNVVEQVEVVQKSKGKAKRKQVKKALKAKELSERLAQAEFDYKNSSRHKEEEEIKKILKEQGLMVKPVTPDGNCMYHAICDQLTNNIINMADLRKRTASYMRDHVGDFMPFLSTDAGDAFTSDDFKTYCSDIEKSGIWGGQLELQAISHVFKTPIHVIQAGSATVKLGEEYEGSPVLLTYHRHELGLGEHYNSVTTFLEDKEDL
ncbi:deubiquitinase OTUD6B-like isoform X1 [Ciona intestinalis]